jgi:hypothetical protein
MNARARSWFEIRHMIAAPATLILLFQFVLVVWLDRQIPRALTYVRAVVTVFFVIQDVFYNLVFGTFLFLEWPREWLFTARIKRHLRDPDCPSHRFALVLNHFDRDHV